MSQYDFSSPFVRATIINPDGTRVPLWVNAEIAADVRRDAEPESMPYVTNVSVERNLGESPRITVEMEPTFREGIKFLDTAFSWAASKIEVQFGYSSRNGTVTQTFTGLLLKPDIEIGEDVRITLQAQGLGSFSGMRSLGNRTAKEGETVRQIITRIMAGSDGSRKLEPDFSEADEDPEVKSRLDSQVNWSQGNRTDWQAIFQLASIAGCFFVEENNTIRFFGRRSTILKKSLRSFRLYDYPDGRLGNRKVLQGGQAAEYQSDYPIVSFSSPAMFLWLAPAAKALAVKDVDDETRKEKKVVFKEETDPVPRTGSGDVSPPPSSEGTQPVNEEKEEALKQITGDPADKAALEDARAEYERETSAGIEVEIESLGIPDLRPGEVITVHGVGVKFSKSNFYVLTVTHTIGNGGFSTSFKAITNIGQLLDGASPLGAVNTKRADGSSQEDGIVLVKAIADDTDLFGDIGI